LRKGKARACESLGFVVNKNNFFSSVSGKRRKKEKGAPWTYDTPSLFLYVDCKMNSIELNRTFL
jgi:hypothetical protein